MIVGRGPGEFNQGMSYWVDGSVYQTDSYVPEIRVVVDWFEELRQGPS